VGLGAEKRKEKKNKNSPHSSRRSVMRAGRDNVFLQIGMARQGANHPRPPQMYHLPQGEGVLLRVFDGRSRVRSWRCVACPRARFARTLPSRLPYGVAELLVEYCLRVRQCLGFVSSGKPDYRANPNYIYL